MAAAEAGQDFWVTPADLEAGAIRTHQGAVHLDEELLALKQYVLNVGSFWSGSAHQQFLDLMGNWDGYGRRLEYVLIGIAEGMHENKNNYVEGELSNIRNLTGVDLPPVRF